jgi:hypothetical protein
MRPHSSVKIDPGFSCPQKVSQRLIGTALGYSELEDPDKTLSIAMISWGASPTHGKLKALL